MFIPWIVGIGIEISIVAISTYVQICKKNNRSRKIVLEQIFLSLYILVDKILVENKLLFYLQINLIQIQNPSFEIDTRKIGCQMNV